MFHCVGATPLQATADGRISAEQLQIKVISYRLRVADGAVPLTVSIWCCEYWNKRFSIDRTRFVVMVGTQCSSPTTVGF